MQEPCRVYVGGSVKGIRSTWTWSVVRVGADCVPP
jgi:hypothetical protein